MKKFFLLLLIMPLSMFANQAYLSDDSGIPIDNTVYSNSSFIYLSGDLDNSSFPNEPRPMADIYIMKNTDRVSSDEFRLFDQEGAKNSIQANYGGGAFLGELICMPPIVEGEYDIIVDEDQDGIFNPGVDILLGEGVAYAFKVIYEGEIPAELQIEVEEIKQNAYKKADKVRMQHFMFEAGLHIACAMECLTAFFVDGPVALVTCAINIEGWVGPISVGWSWAMISLGKPVIDAMMLGQAARWEGIYLDPPDPDYKAIAELPAGTVALEKQGNTYAKYQLDYLYALDVQNASLMAILESIEKFQGAQEGHDGFWQRENARNIVNYVDVWNEAYTVAVNSLGLMKAIIETTNNIGLDVATIKSTVERVNNSGLTQDEIDNFKSYGLTNSEIDNAKQAVMDMNTDELFEDLYSELLGEMIAEQTSQKDVLATLSDDAQEVVDNLTAANSDNDDATGLPELAPIVQISGDRTVQIGATLNFSATDINGKSTIELIEWDSDFDGEFDDGTGSDFEFQASLPGYYLIGVRMTADDGLSGFKYIICEFTTEGLPPIILSQTPEGFVGLSFGEESDFGISLEANGNTNITYEWLLDGKSVGSEDSYHYTSTFDDIGHHELIVEVNDDDPFNGEPFASWCIYVFDPATGIEDEFENQFSLICYPNPANSELTLKIITPLSGYMEVSLFDLNGVKAATIFNGSISGKIEIIKYKTDGIPAGSYLIKAKINDKAAFEKIIILK